LPVAGHIERSSDRPVCGRVGRTERQMVDQEKLLALLIE